LMGLDTRVGPAWFQPFKLGYEATALRFCFAFKLAPPHHGRWLGKGGIVVAPDVIDTHFEPWFLDIRGN